MIKIYPDTKKSILISILLAFVVMAIPNSSFGLGSWWNSDWEFRKGIIIDHTKVDADLSSFAVLIDITDSDLSAHSQSSGADIAFTDENGILLDHEIQLYDNSDGHLVAWVRVPVLSSISDTQLYLYYGNPAAVDQQNVAGTWDTSFVIVQHLEETSGVHFDSTVNANDCVNFGSTQDADGKIGVSNDFDGIDDYLDGPDILAGFVDPTFTYTVSAWINPENLSVFPNVPGRVLALDNLNIMCGAGPLDGQTNFLSHIHSRIPSPNGRWITTDADVITETEGWIYITVTYDGNQPEFTVALAYFTPYLCPGHA